MIFLDEGEQKLFAKYWGNNDLVNNEEFWEDVYGYYSTEPRDAPLPLKYTPTTVRMVHEMLECPPGKCGKCCSSYLVVPLWPYDVERIIEKTSYNMEYLEGIINTREDGKMSMNSRPNGCVFLKDNVCTIYEARPDACWLFPVGHKTAALKGVIVQQMTIRIRCPSALAIARKLVTDSLSKGDKILLPDLTVIPKVGGE